MHPRPEVRPLRRMLVLFVVLLAMLAIPAQSTADDFPTGPGLDWQFPDSHGMYIVGAGEQTSLDRTLPSETGQPDGDLEFGYFPTPQNLLSITSIPATEATLIQGNLTVQLYAGYMLRGPMQGTKFWIWRW
ncbi:MAG: hypothetical protein Ct9H90mP16_04010 [Candidatus Poseidoniales archaeon]|nr:MAG: hypothetical protein Ct9H90mP16_04010 [Candidatus Poseidoniales archaeon]